MAIEQTRVIGLGAYSRQTKVLDQTRKGALEGLVAHGFLGRMLGLSSVGDRGLRCSMNVRLVPDITVLVVRPVVPGECEPPSTPCEVDDPAGVVESVVETLPLVDEKAELLIIVGFPSLGKYAACGPGVPLASRTSVLPDWLPSWAPGPSR